MSLLRNLTPSFVRRMKINQPTNRAGAMPISRTPRDLDEARRKRNSKKSRIRNINRTKLGSTTVAKRTVRLKSPNFPFVYDRVGWRLASMTIVTLFGLLLGYAITNENFFGYKFVFVTFNFYQFLLPLFFKV